MNSSRWWEYYAVRYFIGTVIGAIAVVAFNEVSASPMRGTLFPALSNFKDAGAQHILVILALGLTYCYIASAPILALHALRGEIEFTGRKKFTVSSLLFGACFIALATVGCLALNVVSGTLGFWAMLLVAGVLALQIALLISAFTGNFSRVVSYYSELSKARASTDPTTREYVESYRHLREHGNAFAIALLEVCLAVAIISAPTIPKLVVLVFLWVTPAAFVWIIGTVLESRLSNLTSPPLPAPMPPAAPPTSASPSP